MQHIHTDAAFLLSTLRQSQTAVIEAWLSLPGSTEVDGRSTNSAHMLWKEQASDAHIAALWSLSR